MPSVSTVENWRKAHPWLRFKLAANSNEVQSLHCSLCSESAELIKHCRNYSAKFVEGVCGKAIKKDNVDKHALSETHKKAIQVSKIPQSMAEIYKTTPIGRSFCRTSQAEHDRVAKLMDISYMLAKAELPFAKFPDCVAVEKKHGVQLGETYHHEKGCKEFTMIIGEEMEAEFIKLLTKAEYFSVLMDGSTDSSVTEKEQIYVIFLDDSGVTSVRFAKMKNVKDGTAEGLKQTLTQAFTELGILNLNNKLVSIGVDGASVNTGCKNGLGALLKKDGCEWLVVVHCLNHRLELAVKDAFSKTYFTDVVCNMLMNLYYLYEKSPKRLRNLKEVAEIMDEQVLKPEKAHGTRWLQHKVMACDVLSKSYHPIITHLETLAATEKTADQAKLKGYLKTLKSVKFVSHMLFFQQLLKPLANISQCLQSENIDLLMASTLLEALSEKMEGLKTKIIPDLESILMSLREGEDGAYKNVTLSGHLGQAEIDKIKFIDKVVECCTNRFSDLDSLDVFKSVKILDVRLWPQNKGDLLSYGNEELDMAIDHFRKLLVAHTVDLGQIKEEWTVFKNFWFNNMKSDSLVKEEVWGTFFRLRENYPNLCHIINILSIYPVSNATVERGFSTMRRIKSDWRNRLQERSLELLMRISIDGPPFAEFDSSAAVNRFFETPRHASVKPYGKRKSGSSEINQLDHEGDDTDSDSSSPELDLVNPGPSAVKRPRDLTPVDLCDTDSSDD